MIGQKKKIATEKKGKDSLVFRGMAKRIVKEIDITSWLVSAYDFYSRVVKDC